MDVQKLLNGINTSMSVRWISRSALVPSEKRRPPIASISSMKMTQGSWSLAYPNISRTTRALSPIYLSTMAEDTTLRKFVERVAGGLGGRCFEFECECAPGLAAITDAVAVGNEAAGAAAPGS